MKRKDFLKITSGLALSLVSRGWAGVGSSLLSDGPRSSSGVPKKGFLGESRRLGGLEDEVRLINAMSRERVLKTYVNEVKKNYDYVLIDCMPSLGMIKNN